MVTLIRNQAFNGHRSAIRWLQETKMVKSIFPWQPSSYIMVTMDTTVVPHGAIPKHANCHPILNNECPTRLYDVKMTRNVTGQARTK